MERDQEDKYSEMSRPIEELSETVQTVSIINRPIVGSFNCFCFGLKLFLVNSELSLIVFS